MARYNIDITALNETRLHGDTELEEVGAGYTFLCVGHPQDAEAHSLLDDMHSTHLAWINDKNNVAKKSAYTRAKKKAQKRLQEMKNHWWNSKAAELQHREF